MICQAFDSREGKPLFYTDIVCTFSPYRFQFPEKLFYVSLKFYPIYAMKQVIWRYLLAWYVIINHENKIFVDFFLIESSLPSQVSGDLILKWFGYSSFFTESHKIRDGKELSDCITFSTLLASVLSLPPAYSLVFHSA